MQRARPYCVERDINVLPVLPTWADRKHTSKNATPTYSEFLQPAVREMGYIPYFCSSRTAAENMKYVQQCSIFLQNAVREMGPMAGPRLTGGVAKRRASKSIRPQVAIPAATRDTDRKSRYQPQVTIPTASHDTDRKSRYQPQVTIPTAKSHYRP